MKRVFLFIIIAIITTHCGVNQQIKQMQALEKCKYQITSADSIFLANTDVSKMISTSGFNLESAPGLAFAFLQRKVPLKARLNLRIINPGKAVAGINEFEYIVMIKDQEITNGRIDQKVTIPGNGGVTMVPIVIDQNIYPLLSKSSNRNALVDFFSSKAEEKTTVTLKIKPSIGLGGEKIQYPGYVDIKKEITNKQMISAIRDLTER